MPLRAIAPHGKIDEAAEAFCDLSIGTDLTFDQPQQLPFTIAGLLNLIASFLAAERKRALSQGLSTYTVD